MFIILYLVCNCCFKCCPYRKLESRIEKLFKSISHKRKTEENNELDEIVVKPIERVNLKREDFEEDILVTSNKRSNDSGEDSLDSITNRLIDSTL